MQRAKIGLDLITLDLKNARSRNNLRMKQQRTQALMVNMILFEITRNIKELRKNIRNLEKYEWMEKDQKKIRRNEGGRNLMVATYGKF
jgi:hypothetical protein